jgi:hypothetical protein
VCRRAGDAEVRGGGQGGDVALTLRQQIEQLEAFAGGQGLADPDELVEQCGLVLAVTHCHSPPKFCGIV